MVLKLGLNNRAESNRATGCNKSSQFFPFDCLGLWMLYNYKQRSTNVAKPFMSTDTSNWKAHAFSQTLGFLLH
jgi:hypothetical protein